MVATAGRFGPGIHRRGRVEGAASCVAGGVAPLGGGRDEPDHVGGCRSGSAEDGRRGPSSGDCGGAGEPLWWRKAEEMGAVGANAKPPASRATRPRLELPRAPWIRWGGPAPPLLWHRRRPPSLMPVSSRSRAGRGGCRLRGRGAAPPLWEKPLPAW
uniref:Uncharacterized protein n=1 Tax=Arundo donax TaxID=35708 RepID=A0A0A8YDT9_ARUDO